MSRNLLIDGVNTVVVGKNNRFNGQDDEQTNDKEHERVDILKPCRILRHINSRRPSRPHEIRTLRRSSTKVIPLFNFAILTF